MPLTARRAVKWTAVALAAIVIFSQSYLWAAEISERSVSTKVLFELRPVSDVAKEGYARTMLGGMQGEVYVSEDQNETVRFYDTDITTVRFSPATTFTGKGIIVNLSRSGKEKMEKSTGARTGERLAIIVDNKVISVPLVRAKVQESLYIMGSDDSETERLAAIINRGKPVAVAEPERIWDEDTSRWPPHILSALWTYSRKENVRYAFTGDYKVTYEAEVCRPAASMVAEMVKSMTAKGWKRLLSSPADSTSETSSTLDPAARASWREPWWDLWQDRDGNAVSYSYRYEDGVDEVGGENCRLKAVAAYTPANIFQHGIELLRAIKGEEVSQGKKGEWNLSVSNSVWIPQSSTGLTRSFFNGAYRVRFKLKVCHPGKEVIDGMVKSMESKGWKRLSYDPVNPGSTPCFLAGKDACLFSWEDYWRDKDGNVIFYRYSWIPEEGLPEGIVRLCMMDGVVTYHPAAVWDAGMKWFAEVQKEMTKLQNR